MKIGPVDLRSPFAVAPMAGMTDTAFRRLVKRHGGCGLVVTEMVSSEGLVRGIDRTLEYAEYTEEERPISIQIFGGDPDKMAAAAQIVEGMGADIVDVNMGCPVPKIAKHQAGCSLMREPAHAAAIVSAMTRAVRIPVTVKMRAGWNDSERNAPTAREDGRGRRRGGGGGPRANGGAKLRRAGPTGTWWRASPTTSGFRSSAAATASSPRQIVSRWRSGVDGVLVGRGVLRNPWILAQAADLAAGRPPREVTLADRGRFLLDYIDLLRHERVHEPEGFRHIAPATESGARHRATRAGPRSVGDQQGPRARLVVHQGPRERLPPADRHQQRGIARRAPGNHRLLLCWLADSGLKKSGISRLVRAVFFLTQPPQHVIFHYALGLLFGRNPESWSSSSLRGARRHYGFAHPLIPSCSDRFTHQLVSNRSLIARSSQLRHVVEYDFRRNSARIIRCASHLISTACSPIWRRSSSVKLRFCSARQRRRGC